MKILIYGLSQQSIFCYKAIKKEHEIVGFTDSYASIGVFCGKSFYKLESLDYIEFDYIVIGIGDRKISEKIKNILYDEYNIEKSKILDFYECFSEQKVDKVMQRERKKYDGIILGLLHSALGINPEYLSGEWCNLANGSEDIFYHYKVLEKCIEKYLYCIENIQKVVIDLYDYTVFNYDTSLSKQALFYWSHGGFMEDLHNYANNANYTLSAAEEMKKEGYYLPLISDKDRSLRATLFDEQFVIDNMDKVFCKSNPVNLGYNDYPLWSQFQGGIQKEPMLPFNLHFQGAKLYEDTIVENKKYLELIIKMLRSINPQIKIYYLLLPRYYIMEEYHNMMLATFKSDFEIEIKEHIRKYKVNYLNLKNLSSISNNNHFFQDTAHLNYIGGIAFTSMLNQMIT